jgi:hypothetical protein
MERQMVVTASQERVPAMKDLFHIIEQKTSEIAGSASAFVAAIAVILAWAVLQS